MKIEHPNALRFILQDEIYLLDEDKGSYSSRLSPVAEPDTPVAPEIVTPPVNFNYLGANKKNFLVLVSYTDHEFMAGEHLTALESVLGRLGYTREDVAILNILKHPANDHEQLTGYFEPKMMVILGKGSVPAGMGNLKFNSTADHKGVRLLYTFGFDEMMANNDHKKAFWEQMKAL